MLLRLAIKDYILIENLEIDFSEGLNVLTGETGAGKSIILGALRLALGERNSGNIVRTGADKTFIQALFDIDGQQTIFSREILANGRSIFKINQEIAKLNQAQELAGKFLTIHGQNDQQQLLDANGQRQILDSFLDEDGQGQLAKIADIFQALKGVEKELNNLTLSPAEIAREIDIIDFQIEEIETAQLSADDDEIEEKYRRLKKLAENSSLLYDSYWQIDGEDNEQSITRLINQVSRQLNSLEVLGDDFAQFAGQSEDISYQLAEIAAQLYAKLDSLNDNADNINALEARLDKVSLLKKKYGKYVSDILAFKGDLGEKRIQLEASTEKSKQLKLSLEQLANDYQKTAVALSQSRQKAADKLTKKLETALLDLNFKEVQIEVKLEQVDAYQVYGQDKITILISLNKGQALADLKKVASGGEISRIMLAIKAILAAKIGTETLVFDEIDSGISGVTASLLADKLYQVADYHQVICISHLSQLALMADRHFKIEKSEAGDMAVSSIKALDEVERVTEISRIMGGIQSNQELQQEVEKILQQAEQRKTTLKQKNRR